MGQRHEAANDAGEKPQAGTLRRGAVTGSPALHTGGNGVLRRIGGPAGFRERGDDGPDGRVDRHRASRGKRGSRAAGHTVVVRNCPKGAGRGSSPFATADGWRSLDPSPGQPAEGHGQAGSSGTPLEKERTVAHLILGTGSARRY